MNLHGQEHLQSEHSKRMFALPAGNKTVIKPDQLSRERASVFLWLKKKDILKKQEMAGHFIFK